MKRALMLSGMALAIAWCAEAVAQEEAAELPNANSPMCSQAQIVGKWQLNFIKFYNTHMSTFVTARVTVGPTGKFNFGSSSKATLTVHQSCRVSIQIKSAENDYDGELYRSVDGSRLTGYVFGLNTYTGAIDMIYRWD